MDSSKSRGDSPAPRAVVRGGSKTTDDADTPATARILPLRRVIPSPLQQTPDHDPGDDPGPQAA